MLNMNLRLPDKLVISVSAKNNVTLLMERTAYINLATMLPRIANQ